MAKQIWQTWWSIIGPSLPETEQTLFNQLSVAPSPEVGAGKRGPLRAPRANIIPPNNPYFVRHLPPIDEVFSEHRLQIDVEASNQDEASNLAHIIADRLVAGLTLAFGERYYVELRMLRKKGETREFSAFSQTVSFFIFGKPKPMDSATFDHAGQIYKTLESNTSMDNAYSHLLTAWKLEETSGMKPLQQSILQHYVLAIEAVVNAVMSGKRKVMTDKIRIEERSFANEFANSFVLRADKPKAIREASTRLREISYQNTLPSIDLVCAELKIADDMRDQAKELYKFRSSSLSHPGRSNQKDLDKWLTREGGSDNKPCLADHIARTFLSVWCEAQIGE